MLNVLHAKEIEDLKEALPNCRASENSNNVRYERSREEMASLAVMHHEEVPSFPGVTFR